MKGYVITLKSADHAVRQLTRFERQAKKFNYNVEVFWAIEGKLLTEEDFTNEGLVLRHDTMIAKRKGAQGCFMSHWKLWHHCRTIGQPIIIFESDAYITNYLPDLDLTKGIVKLHKDRGSKTSKLSGRWSKGAHAYALSPEHADTLIKCVKDTEVKPVDKIIASKFVDWYHLDKNLVQQMPLGLSTTALTI